jgi:predicted nucleic acid-binding Zn ribbon protein
MCYGSPVTKQCPQCQAIANKVISPVAFKIKGYSAKNDYSKAGITKEELDRHDGKEEKDE